ncbi:FMN phosphatase YigB (HAD superfamily) [Rhizobium sp. RAS22]|nr:FMN phosphatase YigB (HAD superfamily) [Rhizobium sp. RAS22]
MNLEIIERGQRAQRLSEYPEFRQTLEAIRQDLFKQFVRTNIAENEAREQLHHLAYFADLFEKKVTQYAGEAKFELERSDRQDDA